MEPSKKQLAMEAKRNRRTVTVETGRPWLGLGGWLQRKEQAPWGAGPTCRRDRLLGLSSMGPLPANCQFAAFPLLLAVGSSRACASSIRFNPGPTCRARAALAVSRHCQWGPRLDGPTCHRSALRRTSLFSLHSSLLS